MRGKECTSNVNYNHIMSSIYLLVIIYNYFAGCRDVNYRRVLTSPYLDEHKLLLKTSINCLTIRLSWSHHCQESTPSHKIYRVKTLLDISLFVPMTSIIYNVTWSNFLPMLSISFTHFSDFTQLRKRKRKWDS